MKQTSTILLCLVGFVLVAKGDIHIPHPTGVTIVGSGITQDTHDLVSNIIECAEHQFDAIDDLDCGDDNDGMLVCPCAKPGSGGIVDE
jgi:hypothetical protein